MIKSAAAQACPGSSAMFSTLIALIFTNVLDAAVATTQVMYFACSCAYCPTILASESKWKAVLTCCIGCSSTMTCCLFGGFEASLHGDFGDMALALSNYSNNNRILDITVSDIAAGLVMAVRRQREALLAAREKVHHASSFGDSSDDDSFTDDQIEPQAPARRRYSDSLLYIGGLAKNKQDLQRLLRRRASTPELYTRCSSVIGLSNSELQQELSLSQAKVHLLDKDNYKEKLYIAEADMDHVPGDAWGHNRFLAPGISHLRRSACFCQSPRSKLRHDFLWEPHLIAFKELAGIDDPEDIVFASFKESIDALPYVIAMDHKWKSVVIAIRGTWSMESVLADLAIRPVELSSVGAKLGLDGDQKYCHRGTLKSAEWIYDDLMKHGKLKEVLAPPNQSGDDKPSYQDYRLVVVGHLLGGGCAAMLSVMLRPEYPNLRCLAFAVLGSVFSENLAQECSPWLSSYILDADVVPRIAFRSFEEFRDSVLTMIGRIKVSKRTLFSLEKSSTKSRAELIEEQRRLLYEEDAIPDSEYQRQLVQFWNFQEALKQKFDTTGRYIDLFPPGKII